MRTRQTRTREPELHKVGREDYPATDRESLVPTLNGDQPAGTKRKADDQMTKDSSQPHKRHQATMFRTAPRMGSLAGHIFSCMEFYSSLGIDEIAQLANTLAYLLRRNHGGVDNMIGPKDVYVILVRTKQQGPRNLWYYLTGRRAVVDGFSLHVTVGKRVAVRGTMASTRKGALEGLRDVVEKLACD